MGNSEQPHHVFIIHTSNVTYEAEAVVAEYKREGKLCKGALGTAPWRTQRPLQLSS